MSTKLKNKTIPKNWQQKQFVDCVDLVSQKKLKGFKKNEYKKSGQFPIVDQGQSFISGYTNESERVSNDVPLILFGDHTRIVKYIDFPFAIGADGTKLLKSVEDINTKFLYYYALNLEIPNTGYNRHFKLLKSSTVNIPPIHEQKKIADILSAVDDDIEKTDEIIHKSEKLKKGLTKELLNKSNHLKKTKFSSLVKLRKEKSKIKNNFDERYIGLEHIEQEGGRLLGCGKSSETKSINSVFKKNDILFGKLRPYLRKYWKAKFDGVCTSEILVFEPRLECDGDFILYLVQSEQFIQHSESKSFGTKMPRTDWKIISEFEIEIPPPERRKKIAEILSTIDKKIEINKQIKNKLTELKKGLMQDLLSGDVRINKIYA